MKKIVYNLPLIALMVFCLKGRAQSYEVNNSGLMVDKTTLAYNTSPEPQILETCSGQCTSVSMPIAVKVLYVHVNKQLIVDGTNENGEVEVWDVNANTIVKQISTEGKTVIKTKRLQKGTYFVNYSNGTRSEGTKLVVQ